MLTPAHVRITARMTGVALLCAALLAPAAFAIPSSGAPQAEATIPAPPVDTQTEAFRQRLAGKQAELDALEQQLDALDREFSIAAEAYNKAALDLDTVSRKLDTTKEDLADAETAFAVQQDTLSRRARDIYRSGTLNPLDVLLGAKSVTDLVARVRFLHSIGESDADIAALLEAQRDQMARTAADLEDDAMRARSLEFELQARRIEVVLRIEEREALLAAAQTDLLELLEAQATERQRAEAELLRRVLAGVAGAGITVEPGSPVETALGYHGVPYLWGGETTRGFDCSGLLLYVFRQHGVFLPHYSGAQFLLGEKVAPADLQPGDAIFFGSPVHHVGMYVGGGFFIHAPRTGDFVKLSRLADRTDYAGARRYEWSRRTAPIAGAVIDPVAAVR